MTTDSRLQTSLWVGQQERTRALMPITSGISAGVHYPIPLHRQPAYLSLGYNDVRLPITGQIAAEALSLPMYPELTEGQVACVAEAMKEFLR